MFTRARIFGTYRTIVLDPQESSFEKLAALRFPSTNLATDGCRLFFLAIDRKKFYLEWGFGSYRTSLQHISFEKIEICLLRSITLRADTRRLLHC